MNDCPICMEHIEIGKNCTTTECGHCFHTNCLMQNVAHNGFGCPYCRSRMAEEPIHSDEESDTEDFYSESDISEEPEIDDDALRGFRFFFNNINGEPHDSEDIAQEEAQNEEWSDDDDNEFPDAPPCNVVAQKLREQGVTFDQLVKALCLNHAEYQDNEENENLDNELFGKIRIIVTNYTRAEEQTEQIHEVIVAEPDLAAQAKNVTVRRRQSDFISG